MNGTHFNDMGHNKRHMIEHPKQKSQGGLPKIFQSMEEGNGKMCLEPTGTNMKGTSFEFCNFSITKSY